ncbi:UNVERIFIED_ORG: hypothetical protein [Escherichia phage CMSTMSU]
MLEIEMRQLQAEKFKYFLEAYRRALSSSDCKSMLKVIKKFVNYPN